ncbi:hypothetical protein ACFQ5F_15635 [Kroppenstedtia eburnea]|uniref:hypothetical protein n=1 Tax=Kroppenstedtia eburnea TaxID=714067 RepID=UPI00058F16A7
MRKRGALGAFLTVITVWINGCSALPEMHFDGRTVSYKGREYTVHPQLELKHEHAGADVGQADGEDIFQQIKGLSPKKWLANCMDVNGPCLVYTEKSLGEIDLKRFAAKEMVVRESGANTREAVTIRDRKKIGRLVETMSEQPPTKYSQSHKSKEIKYIYLRSDRYPSVEYVLRYEKDRKGERYLAGDKLVKLGDALSDFLK